MESALPFARDPAPLSPLLPPPPLLPPVMLVMLGSVAGRGRKRPAPAGPDGACDAAACLLKGGGGGGGGARRRLGDSPDGPAATEALIVEEFFS